MDKVEELLHRAVDTIYPSRQELEKVLRSGKKLTLYQGFDPTGTQLHLGHMIGLRKLRQWQDLDHTVIFLIGDGTGQAGDPSGKTKSRGTFLTNKQLRDNAVNYVKQAAGIVRFDGKNPVKILYNGDWLNKLMLVNILDIAGHFTLQQMIERDLFQERIKKNEPVNLREFLYPLLQGYDSVAMEVDLELGGTDQTFNMLTGRTLVDKIQGREKFVMTTPLLSDAQGQKIGKTEGNVIGLTDNPNDLYSKIMALPDDVIVSGLEYLTSVPMDKIKEIAKQIQQGKNPMPYKKLLAYEIVAQLRNTVVATKAQNNFGQTVQEGKLPHDIPTITVKNETPLIDIVLQTGSISSKSELKRLVEQKGVRLNSEVISDVDTPVSDNDIIEIGKHRVLRIKTT